jgi:N-acetylglutamate synthase-like GNAT family acetyltransferase
MADSVILREARPGEEAALTALARRAKARWPYPPEWLLQWAAELTVTPDDLMSQLFFVAERAGQLVGFCALARNGADWILTQLWVEPAVHKSGVGRSLLEHAMRAAAEQQPTRLFVESDPFAAGFYAKAGGQSAGAVPAPMPGAPSRELPLFVFELAAVSHG